MIEALHSSFQLREVISFPSITNAKVQKMAYTFFGAISFFVAGSLSGYGGLIGLLSLPLYLLTATFAIRFFEVKDYGSEKNLESYRNEAKEQTFEQVLRTHGLENVLKYEILPLQEFATKLGTHIDTLSLTDLAMTYLQLRDVVNRLSLKIDNFRDLFVRSFNQPSRDKPSVMFEKEDMSLIVRTGLLREDFLSSYQDYLRLKKTREDGIEGARQKFSKQLLNAIQIFEKSLTEAKSESQDAMEWIGAIRRDIAFLRNNLYPSSATDSLPIWKLPKEHWSSELSQAHITFKNTCEQLNTTLRNAEAKERSNFETQLKKLDSQFGA